MTVYNKLYGYQKKIVDIQKNKSHALFMDMGTGKTITSLALFEKSDSKKLLIICLVSKLNDWKMEVNQLFPELEVMILNKGSKLNTQLIENNYDVLICNYESVWRLDKALINYIDDSWFIIVDESHKIKNTHSKVGKFMGKLGKKTASKCILTGTPQNNGYLDYYNQLSFIDVLRMSEKEFKKEYCVFELQNLNGHYFNTLVGYKNYHELDAVINNNCVFFKRDIDDEMIPSEVYETIQKHKSHDQFKKSRVWGDVIADNATTLRMYLRQMCSGFLKQENISDNKLKWLEDFFDSYDKRIVIFCNFNMEVNNIVSLCNKMKRPYSIYNGMSKDLSVFKRDDSAIVICNYASAAMGLNDLVLANVCVMFSPTEDYILFEQSKKRIDRIGQTKKPLYYFLQTEKSVEVAIYNALKHGKNFDERMFENYLKEF